MLERLRNFLHTFRGAMTMAIFCFVCLLLDISNGNEAMAWVMGIGTLVWLYQARRALKDDSIDEQIDELTEDQKTRIKEATNALGDVIKEVDLELTIARREKDRVQSDKRKDQEAGAEGTDGRTDSKEDRTP